MLDHCKKITYPFLGIEHEIKNRVHFLTVNVITCEKTMHKVFFFPGRDEHQYQIHSIQFHNGMILDPGKLNMDRFGPMRYNRMISVSSCQLR